MDAWEWAQKIAELKIDLTSFLDIPLWGGISQDIAKWALVTLQTERLQPLLQSSLLDKLRVFWNYGQTLGISFSLEEKSKLGRRQSHGKRSLEAVWLDVQLQQMRKSAKENITSVLSNISANQTNSSKNCHFNKKNFRDEISFQLQK